MNSLAELLRRYMNTYHIDSSEQDTVTDYLAFIGKESTCFERRTGGHVTVSAWIVNHDHTQALLTHHRKLNKWLQLGGHADGNCNVHAVALKEAQEESGILHFEFVTADIFDVSIHTIPNSCQFHYDVRFLLQALPGSHVKVSDESFDVRWVLFDDIHLYNNSYEITRMNNKFIKHFLKNIKDL